MLRVEWRGQDYFRNETFSTEFGISIFPKPQELFGFAIRPDFVKPESEEILLTIGEGIFYSLPDTQHENDLQVFYYKVDLGAASEFVTYNKEVLILQIDAGVTVERHIGEYEISLQLIDETGVLSNKFTLLLKI